MNSPKQTVDNTIVWRLWHGINYLIAAFCFLVGSIIFFPKFCDWCDASNIAAWLFTVDSACFLLADVTEWKHYSTMDCDYLALSLNFLMSVFGSFLYFVKRIVDSTAYSLFTVGSVFIVVSQGWKFTRVLVQEGKSFREYYEQDRSRFYMDLLISLATVQYLIGTVMLQKTEEHPDLIDAVATQYSSGGLLFFTSALFVQKRYFCQNPRQNQFDKDLFEVSQ